MHPSSSRAFQRDQECDLKHPGSVDLISTKQNQTNKPPSFIDRCLVKFQIESMCEMPLVVNCRIYQLPLKLSNLIMFILSMPYHTKRALSFFLFLFLNFLIQSNWHHPKGNLAKFGYRPYMKVKHFYNNHIFWLPAGTCCRSY